MGEPIPNKLRQKMSEDPYYQQCCITGKRKEDGVKIEWHHNFIYAGKKVNEEWCILPVSEAIHIQARHSDMKEKLDWVMLNRASEIIFSKFERANLRQRFLYLQNKYALPASSPLEVLI